MKVGEGRKKCVGVVRCCAFVKVGGRVRRWSGGNENRYINTK